jgi:hypothetical protein
MEKSMRGYVAKWLPPPTVDDYMYEVITNVWWGEKERAKRQLIWLMDRYLGEEHGEETSLREVEGGESEKGEDETTTGIQSNR